MHGTDGPTRPVAQPSGAGRVRPGRGARERGCAPAAPETRTASRGSRRRPTRGPARGPRPSPWPSEPAPERARRRAGRRSTLETAAAGEHEIQQQIEGLSRTGSALPHRCEPHSPTSSRRMRTAVPPTPELLSAVRRDLPWVSALPADHTASGSCYETASARSPQRPTDTRRGSEQAPYTSPPRSAGAVAC